MPGKPIKIGLLWHSANSGNLGVGALTVANVALARRVAADLGLEPQFRIIGMGDSGPAYVPGVEAYAVTGRRLLSLSGCWSVLAEQDCVLDIGAGDSFAEIYGFKRFFFLWLTKMQAIARKVPLMLSPQTIGPFTRAPYRSMAAQALSHARAVVTRDELSFEAVGALAPSARRVLSADVAFALPYEDHSSLRGGDRLRVGVNVSGLLFNEAESGRNRFGLEADYARLMRRFIEGLVRRPDVEVHLLAHVANIDDRWDDDSALADRLAAEYPGVVRAPDFAGPSQAKSYISGLDFLTAGRMHACIAAHSAGTPVVPIAYSRKFTGLFDMLEYPWVIPARGMSTDQALVRLHEALGRREDLARDARRGLAKAEALLDDYSGELKSLFSDASGLA